MHKYALLSGLILFAAFGFASCEGGTAPVETAELGGRVVEATTGAALQDVIVDFGSARQVTTGADGRFSFHLPAGNYTATLSLAGYATSTVSQVQVVTGRFTDLGQLAISPTMSAGQSRMVLSWGEEPPDLDVHLTGPIPGFSERFHVYWWEEGSLTSSPFAALQVDNTNGYGPETITISQRFPGIYRFSVHDYSNIDATSSTALGNSRASVRVYTANGQIAEFFVPEQPGTLWTVFELNGATGSITALNQMSYQNNDSAIESRHPSHEERIPSK